MGLPMHADKTTTSRKEAKERTRTEAFMGREICIAQTESLKIRISNRLHPTPRGAQMGWNRVMPEVMRSFFADFRAWPSG